MKPSNQHAPGLGRLNDQIEAMAKPHRRYFDKELGISGKPKRERDEDD